MEMYRSGTAKQMATIHPSRGFINITLKTVGLDFLAQNWLGDLNFAFKSIDQVMESISRRRAEQAELQKDPAWE